jgi:acyl carrier protein
MSMGKDQRWQAIFEKVRESLSDLLGIEPDKIKPNSIFRDDLGADSLDLAEIPLTLGGKFGIEIPDEEAMAIKDVTELVDYLYKREDCKV